MEESRLTAGVLPSLASPLRSASRVLLWPASWTPPRTACSPSARAVLQASSGEQASAPAVRTCGGRGIVKRCVNEERAHQQSRPTTRLTIRTPTRLSSSAGRSGPPRPRARMRTGPRDTPGRADSGCAPLQSRPTGQAEQVASPVSRGRRARPAPSPDEPSRQQRLRALARRLAYRLRLRWARQTMGK